MWPVGRVWPARGLPEDRAECAGETPAPPELVLYGGAVWGTAGCWLRGSAGNASTGMITNVSL